MADKPRVLLFTGDGKGKTTAALGMALRMAGHGRSVRLAQFFKAAPSGECVALAKLPGVELLRDGLGFVRGDLAPHREAARRLWQNVVTAEQTAPADLLILDEIALAVTLGFVAAEEVAALAQKRPPGSATVLTGRDAAPALVELADTVTECRLVKHGMNAGFPAQTGVEL